MIAAIAAGYACGDSSFTGSPDASAGASGGPAGTGGASGGTGGTGGGGTGGSSAGGSGGGSGGAAGTGGSGGSLEGWSPVAWNPDWCTVYQADDPAQALPPEKWLPCDNGIAGCVYLDTAAMTDVPQTTNTKLFPSQVVATPDGAVVLGLNYVYGPSEYAAAVYEIGKGPRAAWRGVTTSACTFGGIRVSPAHFAVKLGGLTSGNGSRVAYGTLSSASVAGFVDVAPPAVGTLHGVYDVRITDSLTAFHLFAPADIAVSGYPPTTLEMVPKIDGTQYAQLVAKGSEIIFYRDTVPEDRAILARRTDGTVVTLYKKPSVYIGKLGGDTERIVWQEPAGSTNELWTATWTTDAAAFSPVKVRDLPLWPYPGFVRGAYAGGWFVYFVDAQMLRAIRVTDGKYVDVPVPKGFWWADPRGAFDDEIFATLTVPPATGNDYSFARVPIASLGVPKD